LAELFTQGLGPRAAHRTVAKKASYTVHAIHRQSSAGRATPVEAPAPPQQSLALGAREAMPDQPEEGEATEPPASVAVAPREVRGNDAG